MNPRAAAASDRRRFGDRGMSSARNADERSVSPVNYSGDGGAGIQGRWDAAGQKPTFRSASFRRARVRIGPIVFSGIPSPELISP